VKYNLRILGVWFALILLILVGVVMWPAERMTLYAGCTPFRVRVMRGPQTLRGMMFAQNASATLLVTSSATIHTWFTPPIGVLWLNEQGDVIAHTQAQPRHVYELDDPTVRVSSVLEVPPAMLRKLRRKTIRRSVPVDTCGHIHGR